MRFKVYIFVLVGILILSGGFSLLREQEKLSQSVFSLRAASFESKAKERFVELSLYARARAAQYNEWIEESMLHKGLVVGRDLESGAPTSVCDSLLFSSLRFVALKKLGFEAEAEKAFQTIERENYFGGRYIRHPDCKRKSSSRDMIVGLMAALNQEPEGHLEAFEKLIAIIKRTGGSVDDGPFYVSRLSPGLSELLRHMAHIRNYPVAALPSPLNVGFSTLEIDSWLANPGFRSHLNAMTLWIELDLIAKHPELEIRSVAELLDGVSTGFGFGFQAHRRAFAAESLYKLDPSNLFFEYLRLRAAGALTYAERVRLLERVLDARAFPLEQLPRDCDRRADYLWQRYSLEYAGSGEAVCHERFPGVDFLWIIAVLLDES